MESPRLRIAIFLIFELIAGHEGATHWVVTEKGMIQSHIGSPLDLRRPYDLISLLDQEKRWNEIQTVLEDLMSRKAAIEEKWSSLQSNPGLDSKMALKNSDCLVDSKLLSSIDLYSNIATNGSERIEVNLSTANKDGDEAGGEGEDEMRLESEDQEEYQEYKVPDCEKYSKLEFSLREYEHFPTLHDDDNVTLPTEESLEKLMPVNSVQLFGNEIHKELLKNSSSWVHYNLGALFWRIKGNGSKAIDCSRRALHFVPSEFRDIPLHNLAGILHKARRSKEAALMLLTAIEFAPTQALHYLALGNVYSSLGDYNNSILYYDKFLELKPNHNEVMAIKKATLCFSKLETHLIDFQENILGFLQGILSDLHHFHSLQQHWLRLSKRLMWEHSSYDDEPSASATDDLQETIFGKRGQRCVSKTAGNSRPVISCDFVDPTVTDFDTLNLQNLFQYVESETQKINEKMTKTGPINLIPDRVSHRSVEDEDDSSQHFFPKFPTSMSTSSELYFDNSGWPTESECSEWNLPINEKEDLRLPVFLPPENKGYDINKILSTSIGVAEDAEHELPWYPPVCDDLNLFGEKYTQQADKQVVTDPRDTKFLRSHFVGYINGGNADEAEIGQRIVTAMEKKAAPNWVLSTMASLYWRVRGNPKKALDCLDLAFQTAPKEQSDVILVSIGSVLHHLGLTNQALKYANLAFKLNYVEPSTNFLLALLHYETNPLLAMYYMKNVLRVDADYYDGQAEQLLKIWGCRIKIGGFNSAPKVAVEKSPVEDICSDKKAFKGQGIICSPSGDECKTASIQCFHTKTVGERSDVAKFSNPPKPSHVANIIAPEGAVMVEHGLLKSGPDGSQPFHMRIFVGDDQNAPGGMPLGDFYVALSDEPINDGVLHDYGTAGTYPLSSRGCRDIVSADWVAFPSMWQTVAARNLDIEPLLRSLPKPAKRRVMPYCTDAANIPSAFLNQVTSQVLREKLPYTGDKSAGKWLGIISGDGEAPVEELGAQIAAALQENTTSWLLSTAAALYWRFFGKTEEAIVCLRVALTYAPDNMKDVPLVHLANILLRVSHKADALEVAYMAVKTNPNFVLAHFTVGNILTVLGDFEEAISFYRSALAVDSNFEPARNRLQAILCTLLFDETGIKKDIPN